MKGHVEIGYLTKSGALRLNRDQVMTLETWLKIHTNASNFVTVSPKTFKIRHASTSWKELIQKSLCLLIFRNITEIVKKIKTIYRFEGCCHKITDICMDLQPHFKSHNLIPVQL